MSVHYKIIFGGVLLVGVAFAWRQYTTRQHAEPNSTHVNSVLAVRGFRHAELEVPTGESRNYEVSVGEEFKVTWKMENATEDGQVLYHGPAGIGGGLVSVSHEVSASSSVPPFLTFTPRQPGIAQFSLTVTGPGPDGIYTLTSDITVTIKK